MKYEITPPSRVSASNFVALDTDKKLETLPEYQFFIQDRTNCRNSTVSDRTQIQTNSRCAHITAADCIKGIFKVR